jgi:hypothetical protein
MRIHPGGGDQLPDPLLAAAHGGECPAFRDCAYVVFEDLALGDFGNRIPALSFEVIADEGPIALSALVEPLGGAAAAHAPLSPLAGFADEGGPLLSTLATIDTLFPLACDAGGERLTIDPAAAVLPDDPPMLPPAAQGWDEGDFGAIDGARDDRRANEAARPAAIRYYDPARDFQPGVQRPAGRSAAGGTVTIEFPGALAADDARLLADSAARRSGWGRDVLSWRITELDSALGPGRDVRVPGRPGIWRIENWEWRSRGVELSLVRRSPLGPVAIGGDAGQLPAPTDALPGPTALAVFETPAPFIGTDAPTLFAAATSRSGSWSGAALYLDRAGELLPIGRTGSARATIGWLTAPLRPSCATLFEEQADVEVRLAGPGGGFTGASLAAIAQGANRLLVGGEVLQFATITPVDQLTWRLSGLLRGRGGTEAAAMAGHSAGAAIALIDDAAVVLDPAIVPADPATEIAAIGLGDDEPVIAQLVNAGLSRRPLTPVHPQVAGSAASGLTLGWTRRARGGWLWSDGVDVPLAEQDERYRVGIGPIDAPVALWEITQPRIDLSADSLAELTQAHPGSAVWVRQVGSFSQSDPLFLTRLG